MAPVYELSCLFFFSVFFFLSGIFLSHIHSSAAGHCAVFGFFSKYEKRKRVCGCRYALIYMGISGAIAQFAAFFFSFLFSLRSGFWLVINYTHGDLSRCANNPSILTRCAQSET
jgi:hypothetical protein